MASSRDSAPLSAAALRCAGLFAALLLTDCAQVDRSDPASAGAECDGATALEFAPELPPGASEGYACFAFDARAAPPVLSGLRWRGASRGVVLHHATLYTTAEALPERGPFVCDPMPADAVALHVWVPGSDALVLPEGIGLELPRARRSLLIEAHLFRAGTDASERATVELCPPSRPPSALAGRIALGAPVPAIRPHSRERSSARCRLRSDFELLFSWPHMHRAGRSFHAALVRGEQRIPVLDVPTWNFALQRTYATPLAARAGDSLEFTCEWENTTDEYVLPGIFSGDEMCTFALIGQPAADAICEDVTNG